MFRVSVLSLLSLSVVVHAGCVTQAVFDEVSQAREVLAAEAERLQVGQPLEMH